MNKKITRFFFLVLLSFTSIAFAEENGRFQLTGEAIGMFTAGIADTDQIVIPSNLVSPYGIYDDINNGMNGYYTKMDFRLLYNPVSYIDIYLKFYARYRPGSPYIPLQLEAADQDNFSLSFDNAWARLNIIEGLGIGIPLGVFLRAGKFDSAPASFQNVTGFKTESVMEKLRTKNTYAFQLEAVMPLPFAEAISFTAATALKLNEAVTPLYDTDGSLAYHGEPGHEDKYDIPIFTAVQLKNIALPFGTLCAEGVYSYNTEGIYSGHNFGADGRIEIAIGDTISIPVGIGIALLEKNIDPMARTAIERGNKNAVNSYENDWQTVSFRRSIRAGLGAGARITPSDFISLEVNLGYAYTQAAHIYRDTLTLNSASVDLLALIQNRFFIGGGLFLGSLGDAEWKTSGDTPSSFENNYSHTFTLSENMGFEIYGGIKFSHARFLIGFNLNKGISMNHSLEALCDSQIIYKQPGTEQADDLFQRGGVFTKLVISW